MSDRELCWTPATELAALVGTRKLSPVELIDAVIARAEALNPTLNAICTPTFDAARQAARAAEAAVMKGDQLGPLHGLPVTIKDNTLTRGVRTMAGSRIFAERVPTFDAPVVERLVAAGAIPIGKTTLCELAWKGCSESPLTGISHNPWKHGMNAGGSSAGAAICAAAGIGPLHQGSDGAGSVRMPAAFCGVFGLKPSFGRIAYYPMPNNDGISHIGPLTRTVGDAALMLDAMAGPDERDQASLPVAGESFRARLDTGIAGLRVAWSPDLGYLRVDPEIAAAAKAAAEAFAELGCTVEEVKPGWDDPIAAEHCIYTSIFAAMVGPLLDEWADRMDQGLVACARAGFAHSAADLMRAKEQRLLLYDRVRQLFERYDLLLTPSLSVAAFPAERLMPEHWEQHEWDWLRWAGFSYPFNLTGLPAATCPCGFTADGLPIGLQITAGRFEDALVLRASRAFEQARPWAQARPDLDLAR